MPRKRLITERTVRDAARAGSPIDAAGATITPAARDLAKHLGVAFGPAPPARADGSTPATLVVCIGSDHSGHRLKEFLKTVVEQTGAKVMDAGCASSEPVDYPVYAARVAEAVAAGAAAFGIMIDGAGIGSAMVANKIRGVRAALCYDVTTAANAREHNNANLLTLGGGLIGERLAAEIVRVFLGTRFAGGRHGARVAMIDALDS